MPAGGDRVVCSLPLMAMYGMAPLAGLDGGGFMADLVLVPYADAMLVAMPDGVDPVGIASMSDNILDGWRAVGPYRDELAALEASDRRVLVVGRQSIGLYAAALGLGARGSRRLRRHRPAATGGRRKARRDSARPAQSRTRLRSLPGHRAHVGGPCACSPRPCASTWPDGVCTDTGVYCPGPVEMPLLPMYTRGVRFVTGRVNARAVIPEVDRTVGGGL